MKRFVNAFYDIWGKQGGYDNSVYNFCTQEWRDHILCIKYTHIVIIS